MLTLLANHSHPSYLIHHPFDKSNEDLQRYWADMEAVQATGLAKSIGVSNYTTQHLKVTLETAKVVPALNQIEFHPYLQHPELLDFHKQHGIATAAYAPLTAATKAKPGPVDNYYASLSKKYAVNEAEIAIRWCIDQDIVAITTSSKVRTATHPTLPLSGEIPQEDCHVLTIGQQEQRLSDYLRSATFKLTPAEIKQIRELGEQKHFRGFYAKRYDANDRT
jgi:diketogulonate reductase-like aldo/keto reductase